ncbi:3561_t:CDS:2, partial [Entrophospora sp. SA101]
MNRKDRIWSSALRTTITAHTTIDFNNDLFMILYLSEINKKEEINVSIDDDDVTVTIETTNSEELVTPLKVKIDPSKGVDIDIENGM